MDMLGFNFWLNFIKIYESKPALWDINSPNYNNKHHKLNAYNALLAKLREIDPNANINMVRRKINSFRTCVRRERNKIATMARQGNEYIPSWKFYPYFSFIKETDPLSKDRSLHNLKNSYSNAEFKTDTEELEYAGKEENDSYPFLTISEMKQSDNEEIDDNLVEEEEVEISYEPHLKQTKLCYDNNESYKLPDDDALEEEAEIAYQDVSTSSRLNKTSTSNRNKSINFSFQSLKSQCDEDEVLACGWMMQYRNLRGEQKIFAKKAIDDILFEAKLETLHRHSVKINESPMCNNCGRVAEQFAIND